jgi:hypothetical protein
MDGWIWRIGRIGRFGGLKLLEMGRVYVEVVQGLPFLGDDNYFNPPYPPYPPYPP